MNPLLLLEQNDRIKYTPDPECPQFFHLGVVASIIEWTQHKKGRTLRVRYDNGDCGEFRSDSDGDYLSKA